MRWHALAPRERRVIIGALVVVAAALAARVTPSVRARRDRAAEEVATERLAIARLRSRMARVTTARSRLVTARSLRDSLQRLGETDVAHDVSWTMQRLAALADSADATIEAMRAEPVRGEPRRRCAGPLCTGSAPIRITVRGSDESVLEFVRRIEEGGAPGVMLREGHAEAVAGVGSRGLRVRLTIDAVHQSLRTAAGR
jgi:hypothetical protein